MIFRKKYSDEEIIHGLQSDNEKKRVVFENYLHDFYESLIRHGQKRYHLSESDSLDCYTDAYMGLVKLILSGGFSEGKKIAPIFKTIFDRKCVNLIRIR